MVYVRLFLLLTCVSLLTSCGIFESDDIGISGITRTSEDGTVIEDDPDDWKIKGVVGADVPFVSVQPAYPNPVSSDEGINFSYSLQQSADVQFNVLNEEGDVVRRIFSGRQGGGNYIISWDIKDSDGKKVNAGLYRVIVTFVDAPNGENHLSTYGDIEVE